MARLCVANCQGCREGEQALRPGRNSRMCFACSGALFICRCRFSEGCTSVGSHMLTIVTLNWARPEYLLTNLYRYSFFTIVDRIICFNNGPPLTRTPQLSVKCTLIQSSENLGLYARLAAASLARTDAIFHTDDDIWVPEATLNSLVASWARAPLSCHALHGRIARPAYVAKDVFGPVEVVLTRAVVCSRRTNNVALSVTPQFDDIVGLPYGNGEDIILSFAAMSVSRSPNFAYRLPAENHPVNPNTAIHRRWTGQAKHRQRVISRCRQIFSL